MRKNRFLVTMLTLTLVFGFVLAGCGGDDEPTTPPQPPATPGKPVVTPAENQLSASWAPVPGAVSYDAMITGGSLTNPIVQSVDQPNVTFSNLVNNTEYSIRVRAKNAAGNSDYGEAETGTPVAATEPPAAPGQPMVAVEYNAITVSWDGVPGAARYQVWSGTSDNPDSATQNGGNITTLSTTITVPVPGTYYVWVKAGNNIGYSGFSASATAIVTDQDPVIGAWRMSDEEGTITYTFKNDGTLERARHYNDPDDDDYTSTYTYNSATKRIYENWGNPPELYGTYSVSGAKLTITEIDTDSYTRHSGNSGLIGAWRQNYGSDNSYYEYEFKSNETVIERYVWGSEVEYEDEYSYTDSGTKITFSEEMQVGRLSGDTLNVYMESDEPIPFTRQGGGSGIIGTWTFSMGGQTMTAVITENKITLSGAESGEYPCRISGNDLFVGYSWEYSYNIDTSVTPHVLTLTEEETETYDRVN